MALTTKRIRYFQYLCLLETPAQKLFRKYSETLLDHLGQHQLVKSIYTDGNCRTGIPWETFPSADSAIRRIELFIIL